MKTLVTKQQAYQALDDLEDFAMMPCSVQPVGAVKVLFGFISQQKNTPIDFIKKTEDVVPNGVILKDITGYSGYKAGSDGEIYSCFTRQGYKSEINKNVQRKLSSSFDGKGNYLQVAVKKDNEKHKRQGVHRLVCIAFHGEQQDPKMTTSHINGIKTDNRPENLCWETHSENLKRKIEHGTDDCGLKNSRAKIDKPTLDEIRRLISEGLTHQKIGDMLGLQRGFISKIANGSRYKRS